MSEITQTSLHGDARQGNSKLPWLPVLMYHRVVDQIEGDDPYHLSVSTRDFDAQMKYLKNHDYQCIYLEDVAEAESSGRWPWKKPVVITLDDGFLDTYTNAFPILSEYGHTANVMLVSSHLGKVNRWDADKVTVAPLMALEHVTEMERHGIRFGSHTLNHCSLRDVDEDQAWKELSDSKTELEDLLGHEVTSFAFPYGKSTPALHELARQAGYSVSCGIEQVENKLYNLSRIDVAHFKGTSFNWRIKVSGTHFRLRQSNLLRNTKRMIKKVTR